VFFISDVPFEKLRFGAPPQQPMPALSAAALADVPTVVLVGGGLLAGIYWITERRKDGGVAGGEGARGDAVGTMIMSLVIRPQAAPER